MSTSLEVVAVTKNIIINRAELSVEDSPIEFTGTDNFLIVNSIVPQPLTETKTVTVFGDYDIFEYSDISYPVSETTIQTNDISEINLSTSTNLEIPVDVGYFNYSSVNDEGLSGDITIKSEASISFGEDDIENEEPEIVPDEVTVNLDTETEKTVLWGNIVKFTANAAQAASTVPYTITGITSEELNDAPLTGFMDLVAGSVEKEFLLTPKNNTTIEDFTFSIVLNQQTTLSALVIVRNTAPIGPTLYSFTDVTFSPGGATGRFGPSLTQAKTGLSGPDVATWRDNTAFFNTSNGIQLWTVPQDGTYTIETWGAQGGNPTGRIGGRGARMRGDVELVKGEIVRILVGQQGQIGGHSQNTSQSVTAGGGGSFVVKAPYNTNDSILVIAGGGGGGANNTWTVADGRPALITTAGNSGQQGGATFGTDGNGATGNDTGGPGAGFFGNGATPSGTPIGDTAKSFINGGTGGRNARSWGGPEIYGGFGGGGGGGGLSAGGGGGYSGGAAGAWSSQQAGGGGGSYNNGTNQDNAGDVKTGNGQVTITNTTPPPTLGLSGPETATFGDTLTYQFLYSPGILADGTNLAYTITGIDSDSIVGNTLSGTIKVYDDGSFLIIKLEDTGISGTLILTVTLPDNSTETFSTEVIGLAYAVGGTVTDVEIDGVDYKVHEFTESDTIRFAVVPDEVEYFILAGGGGGGAGLGGGGGGGGLLIGSNLAVLPGINYQVIVGAAGAGASSTAVRGSNGGNSSFNNLIAFGGGGGGSANSESTIRLGASGGSGGGAGASSSHSPVSGGTGFAGPPRQGFNGGASTWQTGTAAGGGGGFSGAGLASPGTTGQGGEGGPGITSDFNGFSADYAGGGPGAPRTTFPLGGGSLQNRGGGGRGTTTASGINGGSGIVMIRHSLQENNIIFGFSDTIVAGERSQVYTYKNSSLQDNTTVTYSISNITSSELIGVDTTGTLTIKNGKAALAFKVALETPAKNIVLTITAPGDTPATKDIAITRFLSNFTTVTPTVISTTFNDAQPESAPTLSMFAEKTFYIDRDLATFSSITNTSNQTQLPVYINRDPIETQIASKEIMIDLDELTFSLIRIVPVNISISVRDDQELGFFIDADGKAAFAVLDDSNDPRAIQIPGFGTGPVQRWF